MKIKRSVCYTEDNVVIFELDNGLFAIVTETGQVKMMPYWLGFVRFSPVKKGKIPSELERRARMELKRYSDDDKVEKLLLRKKEMEVKGSLEPLLKEQLEIENKIK